MKVGDLNRTALGEFLLWFDNGYFVTSINKAEKREKKNGPVSRKLRRISKWREERSGKDISISRTSMCR